MKGATFTTPGYPAITQITFLACRAQYPGGSNRCDCRFLPCSCCLPPVNGRVGIRNFTFEACSSFTHVAAYQIAARLKSGHLSRGSDPVSYPTKPLGSYHAHRRLHGWVLPPIGDLRRCGAPLTRRSASFFPILIFASLFINNPFVSLIQRSSMAV